MPYAKQSLKMSSNGLHIDFPQIFNIIFNMYLKMLSLTSIYQLKNRTLKAVYCRFLLKSNVLEKMVLKSSAFSLKLVTKLFS